MINAINFKRQTTKARPLHKETEGSGVDSRLCGKSCLLHEEAEEEAKCRVESRLCGTRKNFDCCIKRLKERRGAGMVADYVAELQIMTVA